MMKPIGSRRLLSRRVLAAGLALCLYAALLPLQAAAKTALCPTLTVAGTKSGKSVPGHYFSVRLAQATDPPQDNVVTAVALTVTPPTAGGSTRTSRPAVTLESEHVTLENTVWLYGPDMYSTDEPDLDFESGQTYYILVMLKADEGFTFQKSGKTAGGIDEGFDLFDGCAVQGGAVAFAGSRTFDSASYRGDYLRLKIAVTAGEAAVFVPGEGTYPITLTVTGSGEAFLSSTAAAEGDEVDLSLQSRDGAHIEEILITWEGGRLDCRQNYAGIDQTGEFYGGRFLMPAGPVTVQVAFTAIGRRWGDVNNDGAVNAADALLVLQHSVRLVTLEGEDARVADVDGNQAVNAADALLILQYSVKLVDRFPVEA